LILVLREDWAGIGTNRFVRSGCAYSCHPWHSFPASSITNIY